MSKSDYDKKKIDEPDSRGVLPGCSVESRQDTDKSQCDVALKYKDEIKSIVLKSALDGIITTNAKGEILEFNPSAEKIFGYGLDEVVGKNISEIIAPPSLKEQHIEGFKCYLETGNKKVIGKQIEVTARRSNGEEFPIELSLTEIVIENERLFTAFIRDISERVQAERNLKESERKFRNLVEGSLQGIFVHKDFKPLFATQKCADIFGYENPEEILELNSLLTAFWVEDERERINKYKIDRMQGKKDVPVIYECKGIRKDGSEFWFENHVTTVDWHGEKAVQATVIDINERKRAERELRESEQRYRSIVEAEPECVKIVSADGSLINMNPAGLAYIEADSFEEVEGLCVYDLVHEEDRDAFIDLNERVFKGETVDLQFRIEGLKGTQRWMETHAVPIYAPDDTEVVIGHLAVTREVTERKQAEQLQEAQRHILEQIATGVSQQEVLDSLCLMFESLAPGGAKASVLLINPEDKKLYVSAAPNLTDAVVKAYTGLETGEQHASCGTAAYTGERVIIEDVFSSPLWEGYREFAEENDIRSCWSTPFFSEKGDVLGTFAISLPESFSPSKHDLERLEMGGYLASITVERSCKEKELLASEQRFRTLFDENPCMFFTVNKSADILAVNKFGAAELCYFPEQMMGRSLLGFIDEEQKFIVKEHLNNCINTPEEMHRWEMQISRKNGSKLWARVLARATIDQNNNDSVLIVCEDITEARILSDKLVHQATHDSLTGLINRHEFETRLNRLLNSTKPDKAEHVLCYFDLDQFKIINDTCGHMAGDELLRQLSCLMRSHTRSRDSLARLGGDEFGLLIEHCSFSRAIQIADKLRQAIADFRFYWEDKVFKVGVSIGIVSIDNNVRSIANVLTAADNACYTAKAKGRNRIYIHEEGDSELENHRREMLWTTKIQKAFDEDQFFLVIQSIMALNSKEKKGGHYEFLVRMKDENGEVISPGVFIPVAERYHLISKIDRRVVNIAIDWLSHHPEFLEDLFLCSINLSGPSLVDEGFLGFIIEKLAQSNVPAEKVCFEITETAAIANLASANHFINRLRKEGCKFALDDFGSGLSSFAYLKTLPVDFLKIDGAFVRDIENEKSDLAIVKSIHEISRTLNKKTIAEFVENEAILKILEDIGIDYAQGYAISHPQSMDDLV